MIKKQKVLLSPTQIKELRTVIVEKIKETKRKEQHYASLLRFQNVEKLIQTGSRKKYTQKLASCRRKLTRFEKLLNAVKD